VEGSYKIEENVHEAILLATLQSSERTQKSTNNNLCNGRDIIRNSIATGTASLLLENSRRREKRKSTFLLLQHGLFSTTYDTHQTYLKPKLSTRKENTSTGNIFAPTKVRN
jgi:hypothetical protein